MPKNPNPKPPQHPPCPLRSRSCAQTHPRDSRRIVPRTDARPRSQASSPLPHTCPSAQTPPDSHLPHRPPSPLPHTDPGSNATKPSPRSVAMTSLNRWSLPSRLGVRCHPTTECHTPASCPPGLLPPGDLRAVSSHDRRGSGHILRCRCHRPEGTCPSHGATTTRLSHNQVRPCKPGTQPIPPLPLPRSRSPITTRSGTSAPRARARRRLPPHDTRQRPTPRRTTPASTTRTARTRRGPSCTPHPRARPSGPAGPRRDWGWARSRGRRTAPSRAPSGSTRGTTLRAVTFSRLCRRMNGAGGRRGSSLEGREVWVRRA